MIKIKTTSFDTVVSMKPSFCYSCIDRMYPFSDENEKMRLELAVIYVE